MRILFFGNNWLGWQALRWLREQNEEIVGLVLHPTHQRKYGDQIIEAAGTSIPVFDGSLLRDPEVSRSLSALQPDIGISVLFGYILRLNILDLMPLGCVNIHPALLPYNRGAYPNVWSIVEGTPAGVTLHYMDVGIDTGDIITQREVVVEPIDTGERLYHKLEHVCIELLKEAWPLIRAGRAPRLPQPAQVGTYHRTRDVEQVDEIDLDRTYTARELINVIRARTYAPYPGAYFWHEGRKVHMRLQLLYGD